MEFCKCGSIVIENNCTNKKCDNHKRGSELASYRQINYIKSLCSMLEKDEPDLKHITKPDADRLIKEYEELVELDGN